MSYTYSNSMCVTGLHECTVSNFLLHFYYTILFNNIYDIRNAQIASLYVLFLQDISTCILIYFCAVYIYIYIYIYNFV